MRSYSFNIHRSGSAQGTSGGVGRLYCELHFWYWSPEGVMLYSIQTYILLSIAFFNRTWVVAPANIHVSPSYIHTTKENGWNAKLTTKLAFWLACQLKRRWRWTVVHMYVRIGFSNLDANDAHANLPKLPSWSPYPTHFQPDNCTFSRSHGGIYKRYDRLVFCCTLWVTKAEIHSPE